MSAHADRPKCCQRTCDADRLTVERDRLAGEVTVLKLKCAELESERIVGRDGVDAIELREGDAVIHGTIQSIEHIPLPQHGAVLVKLTYDDEREEYLDQFDRLSIAGASQGHQ